MKVLGIVGSPRKGGNTELVMEEALKVLREEGLETELVRLCDLRIEPCNGCYACAKLGACAIGDDDFAAVYDKMVEADGFIVGSPVYFSGPTPNILALLHRAGYLHRNTDRPFTHKVGGPIVVGARAGHNVALSNLLLFFFYMGMIVPGSTYWTSVLGREIGDAERDRRGLEAVRNFARNVTWTLRRVRSAED